MKERGPTYQPWGKSLVNIKAVYELAQISLMIRKVA